MTARAQPASIGDLRAWLDANPGVRLGGWHDPSVAAGWGFWPDHAELCIADDGADLGCWSIAPAPTTIDVIGRPDENDDATAEAVVRLDRATFAVREGELVRERVRLRDGERWRTERPVRGGVDPTVTSCVWSGPALTPPEWRGGGPVIELGPSSLDEATVLAEHGAFCHRFEARWACAEPDGSVEVEVGHLERVVEGSGDGELWVESEACDGGSEEWDCFHTLHYFVRDGDALVELGSIAVRADREVRFAEYLYGEDGEGWVSSGAGEDVTWDWSPAGPTCVEIGSARAERHHWSDPDGPHTRTRPRVRYGAVVDRLPRYASARDLAGAAEVYLDLEEDMVGTRRAGPTVEDRRGTFRLEEDGWARTEACGP